MRLEFPDILTSCIKKRFLKHTEESELPQEDTGRLWKQTLAGNGVEKSRPFPAGLTEAFGGHQPCAPPGGPRGTLLGWRIFLFAFVCFWNLLGKNAIEIIPRAVLSTFSFVASLLTSQGPSLFPSRFLLGVQFSLFKKWFISTHPLVKNKTKQH